MDPKFVDRMTKKWSVEEETELWSLKFVVQSVY